MTENLLITRATFLDANERIAALEHPDFGDEASIMIWDKTTGVLHEQTPFHDVEMDEMQEWAVEQRAPLDPNTASILEVIDAFIDTCPDLEKTYEQTSVIWRSGKGAQMNVDIDGKTYKVTCEEV